MPAASSLLPWFAPRLSRPMIGVLNNLGHEMHYTRGEVLYESPGFFRPSMHVAKVLLSANRAKIRGVLQRWLQEDTVRWRSHKILLSRPRFAAFWNRVEPVLRTVAATEPGFPIKMPVRDLELHSEL